MVSPFLTPAVDYFEYLIGHIDISVLFTGC